MASQPESSLFSRFHARKEHLRYYLRTWEYLRRNIGRTTGGPIYPTLIQIGTLNRCNGRCAMCPYPHTVGQEERSLMPEALVVKLLDEIAHWPVAARNRGMVGFTLQNEPLIDHRVPDFLRMAQEKLRGRWDVELTTNGTLLTGDVARRVAEAAPQVVNVSANGFSQAVYDKVMPGFSVKQVFENIEDFLRMKSARTLLIVRFVKQAANDAEFAPFRDYWTRKGVTVVGYECNERLGDVRDYESIRSRAAGATTRFFQKLVGKNVFSMCPFLFSQVNILPDGQLLMCCHDYRHAALMGNVNEKSLGDLFNSDEYLRIRREAVAGRYSGICLRCSLFKTHIWL